MAGNDLEAGLLKHLEDRDAREPAQMRAVEKPRLLVAKFAAAQPRLHAPVLRVGYAGNDMAVRRHGGPHLLQQRPRIAQVLERVPEDPAVRLEPGDSRIVQAFDIQLEHSVAMTPRELRVSWVDFDAEVVTLRVEFFVLSRQCSRAAADLHDPARR